MGISSTSFKKGNKAAAKCPKVVLRVFKKMYENAEKDDDILCFADACMSVGWRFTKVDYWVNKLPVFESFKKDIQSVILSRINKQALEGNYVAAPSIWRMKQLGEIDSKEVNQNINDNKKSIEELFPSDEELNEEED